MALTATNEVGGGYPDEELNAQDGIRATQEQESQKMHPSQYEALLRGGEQVTSVLEEMITLVSSFSYLFIFFYPFWFVD